MSYARQDTTLKRLQDITSKRLKSQKDSAFNDLVRLWNNTRSQLKGSVQTYYAPSTPMFNRTKYALSANVRGILQAFQSLSASLVKNRVKDLHHQSSLLHAWMLDQVTPENLTIRLATRNPLREADIINNPSAFDELWSAWLDAYNSALVNNLFMGAIKGQSVSDATDKVDQTKAGFPSYNLLDAMKRIYEWEAQGAINQGAEDIGDANEDAIKEEVWRTRGDLRVCDECDSNEGQSVEDVGFPPLHPNCHCFTELVPASFATLLRSGDQADIELAQDLEAQGVVPSALVIRDADGNIVAKTVVTFNQWLKGQGMAISGR